MTAKVSNINGSENRKEIKSNQYKKRPLLSGLHQSQQHEVTIYS